MLSFFIVLLLSIAGTAILLQQYGGQLRHPKITFWILLAYHYLFFGLYYFYAIDSGSDSFGYYKRIQDEWYGTIWIDFYGVGTRFIHFLAFVPVEIFGFSYEATMLLFAFMGYVGFLFFYLFLCDVIEYRHKLWGMDFIILALFLPNMHFWTVSLGKGSVIFMGLGMLLYGFRRFPRSLVPLIIGSLLVFHVRAHIMLVIVLSVVLANVFSSKGISMAQRLIITAIAIAATVPVFDTFLQYISIEEVDTDSIENFTQHRGSELGKAASGVDVTNYNQFMKVFTFLFRPLFFDAPGIMGIVVSFENLLYLLLFIRLISGRFVRFLWQSPWLVKMSLISFLGISIALAQVSGNLGLAIRQKSQVMFLLFFVLLAYADWAYSTQGRKVIGD